MQSVVRRAIDDYALHKVEGTKVCSMVVSGGKGIAIDWRWCLVMGRKGQKERRSAGRERQRERERESRIAAAAGDGGSSR